MGCREVAVGDREAVEGCRGRRDWRWNNVESKRESAVDAPFVFIMRSRDVAGAKKAMRERARARASFKGQWKCRPGLMSSSKASSQTKYTSTALKGFRQTNDRYVIQPFWELLLSSQYYRPAALGTEEGEAFDEVRYICSM